HELRRAAQLDLKDDREVAIRAQAFEVQACDATQLFARVCETGDLAPCLFQRSRNAAIEDRVQQFFFALEVEIDRAVGDTGGARHVRHLRVEVAVAREDLGGGAQDGRALICAGGARRRLEGTGGTHQGSRQQLHFASILRNCKLSGYSFS